MFVCICTKVLFDSFAEFASCLRKFSMFGVWQNFSKFGLCLKTTLSVLNSFENFFENYSFIILCSCIDVCNCLDFLFYASGSITEHVRGDRYVADKFY